MLPLAFENIRGKG